jgi:iron(III) transport system ATP-binding protein
MAAGLEVPDDGDIFFGDTAVVLSSRRLCLPPDKRNVGMVFQSYAIWPHMTVATAWESDWSAKAVND